MSTNMFNCLFTTYCMFTITVEFFRNTILILSLLSFSFFVRYESIYMFDSDLVWGMQLIISGG